MKRLTLRDIAALMYERARLDGSAQLGVPRPSSYGKYAGTALVYGTADALKAAERAVLITQLLEAKQGDTTP